MSRKKGISVAVAALALTTLLCLALYQFDNKYTHGATQAVGGVLILSARDLENDPVRYLTRQWELYPGALLAPGETEGAYRQYTDIGRTGDFSHGSGTYRLRILLPEEERDYALELPEIFSAYRLYINGRERLAMGEPEVAQYREGIGSRVVTFPAGGKVEILLAVSDFSGLYSGMSYPPAFGQAAAVASARENRLLLHGGLVLLALFGVLLAGSLALRENPGRGTLMLLLCLCFGVATGYPLYHGVLQTSYLPLYPLELCCLYGIFLLAVLLSSSLCELPLRWKLGLSLPCGLGVLLAGLRGAAPALWDLQAAGVFSLFSMLLKYYAAAVLLGLGVWALFRGGRYALSLLCGATGLSVCLLFDRLFPLYEPIYGGWLTEVGGALLVLSLAVALWLDTLEAYRFRRAYGEGFSQMERQLELQKDHYRQVSQQVEQARAQAHDLRHHANTLAALARKKKSAEILAYLESYQTNLAESAVSTYSDLLVADSVLCHYEAMAQKLGVEYDVAMPLPHDLDFPSDELCVVLGNLLENAIEALARQTEGEQRLYLRGGVDGTDFYLMLHNSFSGSIQKRQDRFLSSKRNDFGLGIPSVERIVESHGGLCSFQVEGQLFKASVLIPLGHRTQGKSNAP